jgi:glycosyltransferase involved in cell wall biosynthesis
MRITLVIPSISTGGAERVISIVANHWAGAGREVTLVTFEDPSSDAYPVDPRVRRASLGVAMPGGGPVSTVRYMARVVRGLRREIRASRPDVVISFMDITNILALLAMRGMRVPLVVTEHTDPREHRLSGFLRRARTLLYPRATALVVLTEAVRGWAQGRLHGSVHTIPNPILPPDTARAASLVVPAPGRTVAGMGRLSYEKGFDQLIRAMAACAPRHPDWSLLILGEGAERANLERLAAELGIADRVFLPGWVRDPTAVLRGAALFVVPSRYEGFNCALAEAMSCGLAAVSMDCPSGPGEIIRQGVDGILVPPGDVDALAAAMDRLMSDEAERGRLGTRGLEVLDRFGVEPVMDRWERLLGGIVGAGAEA